MQQISRRLFRSIDLRPCCSQLICGNGGEPTPLAALGARLLSTHSLEFDLLPGTVLSVTCTQRDTNVAAVNGLPDKVELTAADCTVQHSDGPLIAVTEHASNSTVSIKLPVRFCGLNVVTAGGGVSLAGQLNEAPLEVRSSGGPVTLQRARTTETTIMSFGGTISAGEVSASRAVVHSEGGDVAIKRLFGLDVELITADSTRREVIRRRSDVERAASGISSSSGGSSNSSISGSCGESSSSTFDASRVSSSGGSRASSGSVPPASSSPGSAGTSAPTTTASSTPKLGHVELGAAYGERLTVETGGGRLQAVHVSCSGLAMVDTRGGDLTIDGLEGNASLLSRGGRMQVHLHERFGTCFIDSAGGDVEVYISPSAAVASLQVQAGGGIKIDPALRVSGELGPTLCAGTISSNAAAGRGGAAAAVTRADAARLSAAEAHAVAAEHAASARRVGSSEYRTQLAVQQQQQQQLRGTAECSDRRPRDQGPGGGSTVWNSSRLSRGADGGGSGVGVEGSKLVVNAGSGRVALQALSWMQAVARKMRTEGMT